MNAAVRYYTKTGNTKKLAEAIADAIGVEAKPISENLEEHVDALFLCNSVYAANMDKDVKYFVAANKDNIGCIVNVSSAALVNSTYSKMADLAKALGIQISGSEFHCKGEFKFMHKGRPNEEDLNNVRQFAKNIMGIE